MPAIRPRKLVAAVLVVGLLTPLIAVTPASASHDIDYGFESESELDDWFEYTDPALPPPNITRVADGADGVPSSSGDFHAVIDGSVYTYWGVDGGETVWPAGGYTTEIDVYLDMDWADGSISDTFQWNSSVSDPAGDFLEESFFQLRTDPDTANQWNIRFAIVYSGYDPSFTTTEWFDVTDTGWYTLRHTFYEGDGGLLEMKLEVFDDAGTPLGSVVWDELVDYSIATGDVGGPRYGWFYPQPLTDVPIDNATLEMLPPPPPQLTALCMNQYNGDVRALERGSCSSIEVLIEDSLPRGYDTCVNRYNGDLRVTRFSCASTEVSLEPEFVCVNQYNGDTRAPRRPHCSSTEVLHEWAL